MGVKVVVGILYKKKLVVVLEYECEVLYDQLVVEYECIVGGVDSVLDIGVVDEKIDLVYICSKFIEVLVQVLVWCGCYKNILLQF